MAQAVATYGLTHIALTVPDVERAFAFYEAVFGMVAVLAREGLRPLDDAPRVLARDDLASAIQVVTFCALPGPYSSRGPIERWDDIPAVSEDYDRAQRAIVLRVERLVNELASRV